METSNQLLSESFSYWWLMYINSSLDSLGDSRRSFDTQSFIEVDPDCFSMRWTNDANGFSFDHPRSQSSDIDHPDKIFSNVLLELPLRVASSPNSEAAHLDSVLDRSKSLNSSRPLLSQHSYNQSRSSSLNSSSLHSAHGTPSTRSVKLKSHIIRHCAGSLKKILWRYLCFLMPLCKKVSGLRMVPSKSMKSCTNLVGSSRGRTSSCSSIEWCHSNADISIHDAILHCKRSNGQDM